MKKQEVIPEGFVVVTRQIIKDNVYMGDEERTVSGGKAEEQLSLPNDQRNPHWRNVKYKVQEKEPVTKNVVSEPVAPLSPEQTVEIPKKEIEQYETK